MVNALGNQIENRNFLSPIGFKFNLTKTPKVNFFCNSARIPEIVLGTAVQASYLKDIDIPGDKLQYGDFSLRFIVDEELENYMSIHNWLTGMGFPSTPKEYKNITTDQKGKRDGDEVYSDGTLAILNSNYNTSAIIRFEEMFPTSLTSLEFEAGDTDINYFTAEATFKYTIYRMFKADGRTPL